MFRRPRRRERQRHGGMFRSLRTRNYRLFAAGQVVSNSGTWMQRVAQDWLVLELTNGSGTALGIATGLMFLPSVLFGLWGGMLADRYRKRRIIMITQAWMGTLALILGVLALTETAQVWHVYVLAFGLGMAGAVDNPARQSFAIEMVGRADLLNAIALNSAIVNAARVAGPAVGGVLIAIIGTGPVFLLNAASFGAVLLSLYLMREDALHTVAPVPRSKGQLREGLRYVRRRGDLITVLVLLGFVAAFGMNYQMTTALVVTEVFHGDASSFGLASAMAAIGALGGALLAARGGAPTLRVLYSAALLFGLLELVTGVMPTYVSFIVLLVPTGIALLIFTTAANAMIQLEAAPEMCGRMMALYMIVFAGSTPIGALIVGWLAEQFGARASFIASGAVSTLATLVVIVVAAPVPWRTRSRALWSSFLTRVLSAGPPGPPKRSDSAAGGD